MDLYYYVTKQLIVPKTMTSYNTNDQYNDIISLTLVILLYDVILIGTISCFLAWRKCSLVMGNYQSIR